jgi:hypothetical protein
LNVIRRFFSTLAKQFSSRFYCAECKDYKEILEIIDHPHYRFLEYRLKCGHKIFQREERIGFPFDDPEN